MKLTGWRRIVYGIDLLLFWISVVYYCLQGVFGLAVSVDLARAQSDTTRLRDLLGESFLDWCNTWLREESSVIPMISCFVLAVLVSVLTLSALRKALPRAVVWVLSLTPAVFVVIYLLLKGLAMLIPLGYPESNLAGYAVYSVLCIAYAVTALVVLVRGAKRAKASA